MKEQCVFATERYGWQTALSGVLPKSNLGLFDRTKIRPATSGIAVLPINFSNQSASNQYSAN
jgi:hypothetical protein